MTGIQQPASQSPIDAFTDQQDSPPRSGPRLLGSLRGILPDVQCYAALASYPGQVWSDGDDMSISPTCVSPDVKRITTWTGQFNRTLIGYHDMPDTCGRKNVAREPSAENMRRIFEEPRDRPTFIYMSGHTDSTGGERFYITSDSVVNGVYDSSRVIRYSEISEKLLLEHHQEPVILVTDMCECDNLMKLPYVYSYENGKVTCTKTQYHTGAEWDSVDAVHFAATSPSQQAIFFSCGSVYNLALHSVPLEKRLSLEETVKSIQVRMDELLGMNPKYPSQNHRVYSSRKFDDSDFFGTLGLSFEQRPFPQPENRK
ncbi:hypothetical protein V565_075660 [Rhizoctonia solani 123E]|uniref:ICE-like protease (Caspase) p20 domain protein n=1 Tax=Rhizoctonia solani 123E TaxID=1423351 RepID=A0A074SKV8_9AGAM|nr:hypothetical protein V565_075660 [Rhizoctonia solani 123E]